jgi:hypothetical protein
MSEMNVYLSDESYIEPVNPEDKGSNIYGDFSRDYIAGAMRVAIVEDDEVKMIWAPNSQYELIQYPNGTYAFKNGVNGNSTPETSYSYYSENEEGELVEKPVTTDDYASKKFVVDGTGAAKGYSGRSASLVSLSPAAEGEYDQKNVKIRIWFEGTDREAHQALAGGNVNVKLKFVGVSKDPAEEDKQTALQNLTFNQGTAAVSGMAAGMVFSTDGWNWVEYTPAAPNVPQLTAGKSIYIKYPETSTQFESDYVKFTKD